jgi:AraC family transcriptional regulator
MSYDTENRLTYRPLHESALVTVSEYRCRACRGGPEAEEYSEVNNIVLMRHGAFRKHFGRRGETADVNQAVFFSKGSMYRVSHPSDHGDRGTVFTPSPRVLNDIIRELDPSIDDHPERPFPFVTGPCVTVDFWRHHELARRLGAAERHPFESMWADLTALQLVANVLESAFARNGPPRKRRRAGTDADHIDRAEAAKTYMAGRLGERITLDDVARAAHTSPFHLARVFQSRTGLAIHRYLTQLRLRASLDRLADGERDLTKLGLELGFSSHAHFSDAFRRAFGLAPSQARRGTGRRTLRELSKNLKV